MHDSDHTDFRSELSRDSDVAIDPDRLSPRDLACFLERPRIAPHAANERLKVLVRSWRALEDDAAFERGSRPPAARPAVVSALLSAAAPVLKFFPAAAETAESGAGSSRGKRTLRDREIDEARVRRDAEDRAAGARLRRAIPDWTWDEAHRPILAPAAPERILALNEGVLRRLSTAVGDEALFYAHVWPLVVRWAEVAQLLPRSPSGPFSEEGGLFRSGLETAVRSVEHFNAVLPRTDLEPKARRLYTVKMTVAACAAGLFYDAGVFESLRIEAIPEADAKRAGSPSADPFAFPTRRVVFEPMAETLCDFARRHAGFVLELVWTKSVLEERARREAVLALEIRGDGADSDEEFEEGGRDGSSDASGRCDVGRSVFAARRRTSPRADAFYGTSFVRALLWGSDGLYGKFPETAIDVIDYLREHFGLTDLPDDIHLVAAVMAEAGIVRTAAAGTVLHRVECPEGWDAEALGLPSGIRSWNALAFAHPEALVDLAIQSARGRVEVKPVEGPVTKILRDEERERAFAEGRDPSIGRPERPEAAGRPRLVWAVRTGAETSPAVARLVADAVDVLNDRPDAERFATDLGLFIPESAFPDGDLSDIEPLLRLSGLFVMRTSAGRAVLPGASNASGASDSEQNSLKPRGPRVDRKGLDVLWAADEIAGGAGAKSSKPRTRPSAPSDRLGVVVPATRVRIVGRWKNGRESEMPWPVPGRRLAGEH